MSKLNIAHYPYHKGKGYDKNKSCAGYFIDHKCDRCDARLVYRQSVEPQAAGKHWR